MVKIHRKYFSNLIWFFLLLPISIGSISVNPMIVVLYLLRRFSFKKLKGITVSLPLFLANLILIYGILFISNGKPEIIAAQFFNYLYLISLILILTLNLELDRQFLCSVIVALCFIYSLWVLVAMKISGIAISNPAEVKAGLRDYVVHWPQRYSTLFAFAIIVCLSRISNNLYWAFCLVPILLVDFLTFTRSAWLALIVGVASYLLASAIRSRQLNFVVNFRYLLSVFFAIGTVAFLLNEKPELMAKVTIGFTIIWQYLVQSFTSDTVSAGSDSIRLMVWDRAINLWEASPVFGTGFAGINSLIPEIGSFHSQLIDYLSRTGIVGLGIYAYYWIFALGHYARHAPDIFGGLVSIFVYGFFNETTKLSYTGILLFLLINLALHNKRRRSTK